MRKHKFFEAVKQEDVSVDAKVMTSTWAMKKSNRKFWARVNEQGYKQVDSVH